MSKTALRIALVTSLALLAPATASAAPTADFTIGWSQPPQIPSVGQQVTFTGTVSNWDTAEGTVTWNFGDGATAAGLTATHAFATPVAFARPRLPLPERDAVEDLDAEHLAQDAPQD